MTLSIWALPLPLNTHQKNTRALNSVLNTLQEQWDTRLWWWHAANPQSIPLRQPSTDTTGKHPLAANVRREKSNIKADRNATEAMVKLCSWFPCLPRGWPGLLLERKRRNEKCSCLKWIKCVTPDLVAIKSLAIQLFNYVAAIEGGRGEMVFFLLKTSICYLQKIITRFKH